MQGSGRWRETLRIHGNDGAKQDFAIDITAEISQSVNIPVIASGGAGTVQHFEEVFAKGFADAACGYRYFFIFKEIAIKDLKRVSSKREHYWYVCS